MKDKKIFAEGSGTLVHVNSITKKSFPLPADFVDKVKRFEKKEEIICN